MVHIDLSYDGDLHCSAIHGPSGSRIVTDAPTDNMGKGQAFSPTDLVATALGTCVLTTMGIVARRIGFDLSGAKAHVTKEMASQPSRRIGRITVDVDVPARPTDHQRQQLELAGSICPVHKSLSPDVRVEIRFRWAQP